MNKIVSIFLLLFLCSNSFVKAQDKGYVAISGGLCLPGGDLSASRLDFNSNGFGSSGYAKSAFSFDISVGYKIKGNFGIAGMFRSHDHDLDLSPIKNLFTLGLSGYGVSFNLATNYTPWQCKEYMGGLYGSIPIKEKFNFDIRLMTGMLAINSAKISYSIDAISSGISSSTSLSQNSASTTCAAYLMGFGLRYNTNDRWCFVGNFDFLTASPHFNNIELTTLSSVSGASSTTTSFTSNLNVITVSLGVGYKL